MSEPVTPAAVEGPSIEDDFIFSVAFSPEYREDPYPFLARLRADEPVYHSPLGPWLLTRHADASAAVRDPRLSNDESNSELHEAYVAARGEDAELLDSGLSRVMLFLDPPDHTRIRGLVSQAFTPKVVERLRSRARALVEGMLDAVEARGDGQMDVVADLAYPLPVIVICELLGVPPEDQETFAGWSRELASGIDPSPLRSPEQEQRIAAAAEAFSAYFADLVGRRRTDPRDDLLSALISAEAGGDRLSEEELLTTAMFLLIAGHETTVNLIGNGTLALVRFPDELARLRDDASLGHNAVEELLRYDSPVQITQRITLDTYEVGGVTIPPGANLVPMLGAANRDPAIFAEPDRLDLGRANARQHVGFGGGAHFCLGAPLARMEAEIALTALVTRFAKLELADDPVRRPTFTLRGLAELRVSVLTHEPADPTAAFDLASTIVHLGLGATATPVPDLAWTEEFLDAYGQRFAADGDEGRMVVIVPQTQSWASWERHPSGEELVVLLSGRVDLIQEVDGEHRTVELRPGQAVVNPKGVWHTATVHEPGEGLFITPGRGTEHRPR